MSEIKTFKSLLVANRGEIASRIIKTANDIGLKTIAVYTDADAMSPHVSIANEAINIGAGPIGDSYLSIKKIIDVAKKAGADAIHPGYGFLSENHNFSEACKSSGIVFVGPSPKSIELMGNKAQAKRIMKNAGVPCVPGEEVENKNDRELIISAETIGFPLMIKAAAGGGGRGMRLVNNITELQKNCEIARSEAENAFGSSEIIFEKAIIDPRHVEIQIMADNFGNVISLGERDCSVQRRHQKIIEESPSPAVDDDLRKNMGEVACAAAKEINYSGAGTVEFLLDENKNFYFLEMNTRLQVEHPVTELVTDLDLVEMQLKVADGQALGVTQEDIELHGHAMEVRLYAEDPSNNFMPSTGKIEVWSPDSSSDTRYDNGIVEGQTISPFYDPMIAKVISKGKDREEAITKLRQSLLKTALFGIKNNRDFLISILSSAAFKSSEVNTSFLENNKFDASAVSLKEVEKAIIGAVIFIDLEAQENRMVSLGLEPELKGWSNIKNLKYPLTLKVAEEVISIELAFKGLTSFDVLNNGTVYKVAYKNDIIMIDGNEYPVFFSEVKNNTLFINISEFSFKAERVTSSLISHEIEDQGNVLAPMHGVIKEIFVSNGDKVEKGQIIFILEAMKMQHEVSATGTGVVSEVNVNEGDQVEAEQQLLNIEMEE
jgi:geranyl-CoA carboxylase alpha subunit